jgi:G3E family GTPase
MTPAAAPADTRTPVHLLTGFLGSGKTTLLRRWLADPALSDTAVIINEFGEVGLDHLLVREVAEDVVLLDSGCLCCSVRDDLLSTLAELDRLRLSGEIPPYSRAVIETTGLADPAPVMQAILSEARLVPRYRHAHVNTTEDGVNGARTLAAHREARQQLALADRLIVTKSDLIGEGQRLSLLDELAGMNPNARLESVGKALFAASDVLKEDAARADGSLTRGGMRAIGAGDAAPHAHHHDDDIGTFTVRLTRPVEWDAFVDWLDLLLASRGDSILRVKGLVAVAGDPRPTLLQGVQHVLYPVERLPAWPDGTASPGWIVFIASDLTQSSIEASLRSLSES